MLFLWPTSGNPYTLLAYLVFLGFLLIYYFAWARRHFRGPIVEVQEGDLTDIEREFDAPVAAVFRRPLVLLADELAGPPE